MDIIGTMITIKGKPNDALSIIQVSVLLNNLALGLTFEIHESHPI
jgi:hypothetical protein